jgi:hypothetical protein
MQFGETTGGGRAAQGFFFWKQPEANATWGCSIIRAGTWF